MILPCDLKAGYLAHQSAIDDAVHRVLDSGWYVLGKELDAFEKAFAAYVGRTTGVGVASGTDAVELALRACHVNPGDVVFTVSHTAVATVVAVERAGAVPVLVDIDPVTCTMDPESLDHAIRKVKGGGTAVEGQPKAIVVVHLYGQLADMPALMAVAREHHLRVIEDCAQAHGASLQGKPAGTWGDAAAFSFYPTKNLGAMGDGGMVVADDPAISERLRLLREYGWKQRYISDIPGTNSRLDELQAAILHARLAFLDDDNRRRGQIARRYEHLLADAGLPLPATRAGALHVFHQYVLRVAAGREALRQHLKDQQIGTLVHYPMPVHLQPAYHGRLHPVVTLHHTEAAAQQVLSLPMYPQLDDASIDRIGHEIVRWTATHAK